MNDSINSQTDQQKPDCFLCPPRRLDDRVFKEIIKFKISTLYLFGDQRFRGYCILSFDPWHATDIALLEPKEYSLLMSDLKLAARAIRTVLKPDHMNYESLGNTGPHIHWHIIPRYYTDPRWGRPIWEGYSPGEFVKNMQILSDFEYQKLIDSIRVEIE